MNITEAAKFFEDISTERPATVTGQSALVALEAKRNPKIFEALTNVTKDRDILAQIAQHAVDKHKESRKRKAPKALTIKRVKEIIENDITLGRRMAKLPIDDIQNILKHDPHNPTLEMPLYLPWATTTYPQLMKD